MRTDNYVVNRKAKFAAISGAWANLTLQTVIILLAVRDFGEGGRSILTFGAFSAGLLAAAALLRALRQYEQKHAQIGAEAKRLSESALTDASTGLGNLRAFQEELQREAARAARSEKCLTLALIEVKTTKKAKDLKVQLEEDLRLAEFAGLLGYLRSPDRTFRLERNKFAVVMPETSEDGAFSALDRLRALAATTIREIRISIGYAVAEGEAISVESLREHAEVALQEAKGRGENRVAAYTSTIGAARIVDVGKAEALRQILRTGQLRAFYQPIYGLQTGSLLAFEALMRFPDGHAVSGPADAFRVADHMGRTGELDMLSVKIALTAGTELPGGSSLFINLDPRSLRDRRFSAPELRDLVVASGLRPEQVVFEVTERTLAPPDTVRKQVAALHDEGFLVALDDVGSGNSGLELLRVARFDFVKIDRSILVDALQGGAGNAIILAIVAFATETGSLVIAEGIDCAEMLRAVCLDPRRRPRLVIHAVQGFLLGPPRPSFASAPASISVPALLGG